METWLITGGAGFIGSNFTYLAAEHGDARLLVLDRLTYAGNLANLEPLIDAGRIEFVHGDICDNALVNELFTARGIDRVFHFAAESHVDRSILGPGEFLRTNVEGTFCLLQAARAAWTGAGAGKLFLHVSTDEVYGDLGPEDPPFSETTPYRPSSPYSASKAAADHLVRAWHRTYGLPAIITNCSNNYGPWQFPEKFIPLMIINALEERELPVYGDGRQIRDWLHVQDHCEALLCVARHGRPGATYNIGGDNPRTNLAVLETLCSIIDARTGRRPGHTRALVRNVTDRPGHDRRYAIDAARIATELGWRPRLQFERALPEVVDWYLAHRDWIDAIRTGEYQAYYQRQYAVR